MKLSFTGWRRHCGTHYLIERDFSNVEPTNKDGYWGNTPYIETDEESASLITRATGVTLNGDYCVRIELTKAEILNLARQVLVNSRFDEAVGLLVKKEPASINHARKVSA